MGGHPPEAKHQKTIQLIKTCSKGLGCLLCLLLAGLFLLFTMELKFSLPPGQT